MRYTLQALTIQRVTYCHSVKQEKRIEMFNLVSLQFGTDDLVTLATVGAVIYVIIRGVFHKDTSPKPHLFYQKPESSLLKQVLGTCQSLTEPYQPPLLWGRYCHLQTLMSNTVRRLSIPRIKSKRHHLVMSDGATISFDVFEPNCETLGDKEIVTLCVCPGFLNTSESMTIRSLVAHGQQQGYRVVALNHLGVLKEEPLTAPRIFTFGSTQEYGSMVDAILKMYPGTRLIAVGISMGGNLVMKYLGEDITNQDKFICGISVNQGYNIDEVFDYLTKWTKLRKVYTFLMTLRNKAIIRRHADVLFADGKMTKCDQKKLLSYFALRHIDQHYTCRREGYASTSDYYCDCSSYRYMDKIKLPMLVINAKDDPICPSALFRYPKQFAETTQNVIFVLTRYGGHLGFFEGGFFFPNSVTWVDKTIIQYTDIMKTLSLT